MHEQTKIKIGCAGFAAAQKAYHLKFPMVELDKFRDRSPRPTTVDRWKKEAPQNFEFVLAAKAFDRHSFDRVFKAASILKTKVIFFELPPNSAPTPDTAGKLQTFFKSLPKTGLTHVWETPFNWPLSLIENLSKTLSIVPSTNPLFREYPFKTSLGYFRIGRTRKMGSVRPLIDEELSKIKRICNNQNSYVVFDNGPYAYKDAVRFLTSVNGHSL